MIGRVYPPSHSIRLGSPRLRKQISSGEVVLSLDRKHEPLRRYQLVEVGLDWHLEPWGKAYRRVDDAPAPPEPEKKVDVIAEAGYDFEGWWRYYRDRCPAERGAGSKQKARKILERKIRDGDMPEQKLFTNVMLAFIDSTETQYMPYFSKFLEERFEALWIAYQKEHEIGLYDPKRFEKGDDDA